MATRVAKQAVIPGSQFDWRQILSRLPKIIFGLGFLALLIMLTMKAQDPGFLPIEKIRAQGEFVNLTEDMLISKAGNIHGGYFNINVQKIKNNIEAIPWVDRAYVRRVWPGTLMITVKEQRARAVWGNKGLINDRNELFFPEAGTFPGGLPKLSGPNGSHGHLMLTYRTMQDLLLTTGLEIYAMKLDARRALSLQLTGDMKLLLGREAHYERLKRFIRIYSKLLVSQAGQLNQIDMRYTNGFTILRKQ
ncbi:MAG: cell division protein FtsQ/DivIB [Gammaproteobacteria bacterium]|nr:cell division protein FtsQ/DivIB [Gammaproteobacteria bacterium]